MVMIGATGSVSDRLRRLVSFLGKEWSMAGMYRAARLDGVREAIRSPLEILVQNLQASLGGNLESVSVVGSALTDDFQAGVSDVNTVVLLREHSVAALHAVGALAKSMTRHRLSAPLLLTAAYIDRSRDVFGVEFLDFQLTHETILGDDPFTAIHFDKPDVRLQCERELKAMLVRLRQGYVAAAGDHGLVRDILIATAKGLAPLARALLWLHDAERPRTMKAALQTAGARFGIDLNAAVVAERWRYEKTRRPHPEIERTFPALLEAVDRLATTIDGMRL